MKVVRKYKLRSQAQEAADYLMTKGIASNVHSGNLIGGFTALGDLKDEVELEVQDSTYERADELLAMKENGGPSSLGNLNFFANIVKKKKKS